MTTKCSFLPGLVRLCFSAIVKLNNNIQCICKTIRKNILQESLIHDISEPPCPVAALSLDMTKCSVETVQTGKHGDKEGISGEERRKDRTEEMNRQTGPCIG